MQPEVTTVSSNQSPARQAPLLLKVSLKKHSPDEIYDYLLNNVGNLGMKIKKKQAIIGFEDPIFYEKLVNEKMVLLNNKILEFKPIPNGDESSVVSEHEQEVQPAKLIQGCLSQFIPINAIETSLNHSRFNMVKNIQSMFTDTIGIQRKRVEQLRLQLREEGVRTRELFCLQTVVNKKLQDLENRYKQDMEKIQKYIENFYSKPVTLDLEPSFRFDDNWQFPTLSLNNLKFKPATYFSNKNNYPCKRLCPINGEQFAVATSHRHFAEPGYVKIYDLKMSDPKKNIKFQAGISTVARAKNFLIVGCYETNTLKYVNLDDEEMVIQSTQGICDLAKLGVNGKCFIYDIKACTFSADAPKLLVLSTDHTIRYIQLSFLEAIPGVMTVSFEESYRLNINDCVSIEMVNQESFLYGGKNFVRRQHMKKNKTDDIPISDRGVKIKKFGHSLYCVANPRTVEMIDLRTNSVVQAFPNLNEVKSLQVLGEHTIMYGGSREIGTLDDRRNTQVHWKAEDYHKGIVYDILKLKNKVVTCDNAGEIYSWQQAELGTPVVIRPFTPLSSSVEVEISRK